MLTIYTDKCVALDVNLRECISCMPPQSKNEATPFHCDVRMYWFRDAEQECWIYFCVFHDGSLDNPECTNYPDVDWQEVPLDCPDVGK